MIRSLICLFALLVSTSLSGCTASLEAQTPPDEPLGSKRIALTYDDAPRGDGRIYSGEARTAALLDAWKAADTGPVAIFATTRGMGSESGQARIRAYADAGHRIANHTHSHPWASRTDVVAYLDDIDRAEADLAGLPNRRAWFRFPYLDEGGRGEADVGLARRDRLRAALAERDLLSGYVTIDTYDWHLDSLWQGAVRDGKTVDHQALSQVYTDMVVEAAAHYDTMSLEVLGRRPAQVLLLHENDLAAAFTGDMIAALRAEGWTIIDPDEAFADPIAAMLPDTRFSGMGRIAALARDAGWSGSEAFDHWSASEAGIEARLDAEGVFTD